MYQNLILIGRLGTEPVLRETQIGKPVVTFQFYTREKRWNGQDTPATQIVGGTSPCSGKRQRQWQPARIKGIG